MVYAAYLPAPKIYAHVHVPLYIPSKILLPLRLQLFDKCQTILSNQCNSTHSDLFKYRLLSRSTHQHTAHLIQVTIVSFSLAISFGLLIFFTRVICCDFGFYFILFVDFEAFFGCFGSFSGLLCRLWVF